VVEVAEAAEEAVVVSMEVEIEHCMTMKSWPTANFNAQNANHHTKLGAQLLSRMQLHVTSSADSGGLAVI
jgi:hypothetical protein